MLGIPALAALKNTFSIVFTPFYSTLPDLKGFGIESSVEKVGWGLVGAAAAGAAVHGGITMVKEIGVRNRQGEIETLAAFGDEQPSQSVAYSKSETESE